MELSELKSIWQKTSTAQGEGYFVSAEQIQHLIKKKSNTAVAEIKRGMYKKIFMAGSIGVFMILFSILTFNSNEPVLSFIESYTNSEVGVFYLTFGIVICFISIFNAIGYRRIKRSEVFEPDLRSFIEHVLSIIKSATRVKIYSDTLVLPLTLIAYVIMDIVFDREVFQTTNSILIPIALALGCAVFLYLKSKYEQKKRYGTQIRILEECLQELEE